MIWTHLPQRSDMFAVFDVIRKVGAGIMVTETQVLKLIRAGELLEQVDFPVLQDQVRVDEERALSQQVPDNLLHVLVIVKRPLLALRYMLPDGQIRKMQMNFVPFSGCNVALETFRAAGLPIRDKDMPQVQSQPPQSSQSQPQSQERPPSLNASQAAHLQSSLGAVPDSSQPISQGSAGFRNVGYNSTPQYTKPTKFTMPPTSTPGGVKQDEFSRPISAPSRSTPNASGSAITVTSVPMIATPRTPSVLLPSPVFNGTYEPFGSFQVRPMSAPEQTQIQDYDTNTLQLSQMLPPGRTLPFSGTGIHSFKSAENIAQEESSQEGPAFAKTKTKRQTKPRAQRAKPRTSRAKVEAAAVPNDPMAPSSPSLHPGTKGKAPSFSELPRARVKAIAPSSSAPPRAASPELQVTLALSQPSTSPSTIFRKHSLTDHSVNQPNKRQAQIRTETATENTRSNAVAEQPLQAQPCQITDLLINIPNHDLLDRIDNLMRKYYDYPAPKPPPRTSKDYLADYAAQSEDDRVKPINDLICECLKDDDFATFMEDVEGAWKKIGLGF